MNTTKSAIALSASLLMTAATYGQHVPDAASADARADALLAKLSETEKQSLITSAFWMDSAGVTPGLPDRGFPALGETDGTVGVFRWLTPVQYVSLPSGASMAASWNPELITEAYAMVAREARTAGLSVLLAPGVNLVRELRNGRVYEYFGEDPLLSGTIAAGAIDGIQREHVVATVKHFALNDQESARHAANAIIDESAMRESDLLAFELAMKAEPGSVMCSYNLVNGVHTCMNKYLLTDVLKTEWGFKGWVMTDWGATTDPVLSANAGLDQYSAGVIENGAPNPMSRKPSDFGAPLLKAIADGKVEVSRRDDMARRILRTAFAKGVVDNPPEKGPLAADADIAVSRQTAAEGVVLIKNDGILPLAANIRSIVVIGTRADTSVITKITTLPGDGKSPFAGMGPMPGMGALPGAPTGSPAPGAMPPPLTQPAAGVAAPPGALPAAGAAAGPPPVVALHRPTLWALSSPMHALQAVLPSASIRFDDGKDPQRAAALAKSSDAVIIFALQDSNEGDDLRSLRLSEAQEQLIKSVSAANPKVIVVLENSTAVTMPWVSKARGILAAWFPGSGGGEAIADILTGRVNPSGKLPISFPVSERQQPRPDIPGQPAEGSTDNPIATMSAGPEKVVDVDYRIEGADVGYKWFHRQHESVAYPFGYGLSYTTFTYSKPEASAGSNGLSVRFTVRNSGKREGKEVAQVYLGDPFRLIGYKKVDLQPGEARELSIDIEPKLIANWSSKDHRWQPLTGSRQILIGASSQDIRLRTSAGL